MNDKFYITGGTLPQDTASYVTRQADTALLDGLRRGEFCYVLNTRQMGKSSLMVRAATQLKAEGCRVAILDLTAVGKNVSVEQWYFGLLSRVGMQLLSHENLVAFWKGNRELGPMQRFVEGLRRLLLEDKDTPKEDTPKKDTEDARQKAQDRTGREPGANSSFTLPPSALPATPSLTPEHPNSERPTPDYPNASSALLSPLVLFVDEIDAVLSLPFSADEFFAGIRECYNRRAQEPVFARLTFCLLGVATPADLIRDTRTTPFNIGTRIQLCDFTPQEAAPLAVGLQPPSAPASVARKLAQRLLKRVLYWTNGHPYMTQRLCREIAEQQATGVVTLSEVDRMCARLFLSKAAQEGDDNLAFVRNRLLKSEADLPSLLDLYLQVRAGRKVRDEETNPLCSILRLSGAVAVERGQLKLRNRVYDYVFDKPWALSHMPDAELRRQKRAYRLGLMRAAAIASAMLLIVSTLAFRAILSERQARTAEAYSNSSERQARTAEAYSNSLVYAARIQQVQSAYQDDDLLRARDLLEETASYPQRGFEWNYWHRLTHQELFNIPAPSPHSLAVYSRDGKWIVTQQSLQKIPHIDLWDAQDGRHIRALRGRTMLLHGVASPVAAALIAVVLAPQGQAGPVHLIDPRTGITLHVLSDMAIAATLSGDGKRVFTLARHDAKHTRVQIWDAGRGALLFTRIVDGLQAFGTLMQGATVQSTPDSRLLAFGGGHILQDCPLTLLDTTTNTRLWTPPNKSTHDRFTYYGLSPQARYLAIANHISDATQGPLWLWDLHTRRRIALGAKGRQYPLVSFQFSSDERLLVGTGGPMGRQGQVWLWDVLTGHELHTLRGHRQKVYEAEFTPDGKSLFTFSVDNTIRQWNLPNGEAGRISYGYFNLPAFSPDSARFLTADRSRLQVYSLAAPKTIPVRSLPRSDTFHFLSDSRQLAHVMRSAITSNANENSNKGIAVYDRDADRETVPKQAAWKDVDISREGSRAAIALAKPQNGIAVEVRDTQTNRLMGVLPGTEPDEMDAVQRFLARLMGVLPDTKPYEWVEFSEDGTLIVTQIEDLVQLWDTRTFHEVARHLDTHYKTLDVLAMQGGRKIAYWGDDNKVHVWNRQTGGELYSKPLGSAAQSRWGSFTESPDGSALCTVVSEEFSVSEIAVYDMDTGRERFRCQNALPYMRRDFISRDGRFVVWGDVKENAHITELATGREVRVLPAVGGYFNYAAWSPDGKRLVTSSLRGICKLWDTASGAELMTLPKPDGTVWQVEFSPDGTSIAAGVLISQTDIRTCLWNAPTP